MKTDCKNFGTAEKTPENTEATTEKSEKKEDKVSEGGSSMTLIIIIVVAVIVVAIVAAVIGIVVSKGKKDSKSKTTVAPMTRLAVTEAQSMPDREDITPIDIENEKDLTGHRNDTKQEMHPTDFNESKDDAFQTNNPDK